jgi:hypothetical protein
MNSAVYTNFTLVAVFPSLQCEFFEPSFQGGFFLSITPHIPYITYALLSHKGGPHHA